MMEIMYQSKVSINSEATFVAVDKTAKEIKELFEGAMRSNTICRIENRSDALKFKFIPAQNRNRNASDLHFSISAGNNDLLMTFSIRNYETRLYRASMSEILDSKYCKLLKLHSLYSAFDEFSVRKVRVFNRKKLLVSLTRFESYDPISVEIFGEDGSTIHSTLISGSSIRMEDMACLLSEKCGIITAAFMSNQIDADEVNKNAFVMIVPSEAGTTRVACSSSTRNVMSFNYIFDSLHYATEVEE